MAHEFQHKTNSIKMNNNQKNVSYINSPSAAYIISLTPNFCIYKLGRAINLYLLWELSDMVYKKHLMYCCVVINAETM